MVASATSAGIECEGDSWEVTCCSDIRMERGP